MASGANEITLSPLSKESDSIAVLASTPPQDIVIPEVFSKEKAIKYESKMKNHTDDLVGILMKIRMNEASKNLIETEINKEKHKNVPLLLIFDSTLSAIKLIMGHVVKKVTCVYLCLDCCCGKDTTDYGDDRAFAPIIAQNLLSIAISIFIFVVPLFVLNLQVMTSPVGFDFSNCKQADSSSAILTEESFTEACDVASMPLIYVSDPHNCNPLIFKSGVCSGVATSLKGAISSNPASIQYGVFGSLLIYGLILWGRECYEKKNVCIAIKMKGAYFSEDGKFGCPKGCGNWFTNIFAKKFTPLVDYPIMIILTSFYIYSLTIQQITRSPYYIFGNPATASEIQFQSDYNSMTVVTEPSSNGCNAKVFGDPEIAQCSAVNSNIAYFINYKNTTSGNIYVAILQGLYFLYQVYGLLTKQKTVYDWVEGDEIMDSYKKSECPYYEIVLWREKNLSDELIDDWYTVHVYYPAFYRVCMNENKEFDVIHDALGEKMHELKKVLIAIHKAAEECNVEIARLADISHEGGKKAV